MTDRLTSTNLARSGQILSVRLQSTSLTPSLPATPRRQSGTGRSSTIRLIAPYQACSRPASLTSLDTTTLVESTYPNKPRPFCSDRPFGTLQTNSDHLDEPTPIEPCLLISIRHTETAHTCPYRPLDPDHFRAPRHTCSVPVFSLRFDSATPIMAGLYSPTSPPWPLHDLSLLIDIPQHD